MTIQAIELAWFRGAAEGVRLETNERSAVVFGANGSGKSCFVDAVEYALRGGRIQHLAHEYSGRNQEKAVLNTHRPADTEAGFCISLAGGGRVDIEISSSGAHKLKDQDASEFTGLDCARTVLRQAEVSQFIHSTKGEKYSALLPLLGLSHLEVSAENLRQLGRTVRRQSGAEEAQAGFRRAVTEFRESLEPDQDSSAEAVIGDLCAKFVAVKHDHSPERCAELVEEILTARLRDSSTLERRQAALEQLARVDLPGAIREVREAAVALASSAERGVRERLRVIQAASTYLEFGGSTMVECPACGTEFARAELAAHLRAELQALQEVEVRSGAYRSARGQLRDRARQIVLACQSEEVRAWAAGAEDPELPPIIHAAGAFDVPDGEVSESALDTMSDVLGAAVVSVAEAASLLPPPAADLAGARTRLRTALNLRRAEAEVEATRLGEALADRIERMERDVRREINVKSASVIDDISADIQRFWAILHPGEPIEDVRLHIPADSQKAIDISLKFYGKELDSPRLTLSEGYRNSLGLCVFLAMAAREGNRPSPILLDDVIVSLDRGHRGMVAELLEKVFDDRQILVFTHDRDWFTDLRQQLPASRWTFRELLPYSNPSQGIRWAERSSSLADARAYLNSRADTAANEARKVMDVELAIYSERLEVSLPFARGARNDRRGAHEFLSGLLAEGSKKLKKRVGDTYHPHTDALNAFQEADTLLVTWGNRGSHSPDVTPREASRLIEACEAVLTALRCRDCGTPVYHLKNPRNGSRECQCGAIRWK